MAADLHLVGADYVPPAPPQVVAHHEAEAMDLVAENMQIVADQLLDLEPGSKIGADLKGWAARLEFAAIARRS